MNEQTLGRRSALRVSGAALAGAVGGTLFVDSSAGAAPSMFNPITPYRSVDTRSLGAAGKLPSGFFDDWDVWTDASGAGRIPSSAAAITYNLTVTQTERSGFLVVTPARQSTDVSSINWMSAGVTIANAATVALASSPTTGPGSVSVFCGGASAKTHYIIDVTGYYA